MTTGKNRSWCCEDMKDSERRTSSLYVNIIPFTESIYIRKHSLRLDQGLARRLKLGAVKHSSK